jgi:uncharacterized protein YbjT (DUF2867 family)
MGPTRAADGALALTLPLGDAHMPGIAAEDVGPCALALLGRGAATVGKTFGIASDHVSGQEMAAALGSALGERVDYRPLSVEQYRALPFPGSDDLANMFQFYQSCEREFRAARDVGETRALHPRVQSFATWAVRNAGRIPIQQKSA